MKTFNYIYKITNEINGKIYIGKHSTDDLNDGYMGSGVVLKQAIKKYGVENFTKEILEFCDKEVELNDLEKHYIDKYKSTDKSIGYNLTPGGDGNPGFFNKGKHHSEETKKKIGESVKGDKNGFFGKHHSEETKNKISESKKGIKLSDETIKKLCGRTPWCKGKHLTEETKKKLSEYHKGRHLTEETKKKLSELRKGISLTEEIKKKIGEANKGKTITEDTRRKISETLKCHIVSEDTRIKMSESKKGKHHSEEHKRKIGEAQKGRKHTEETRRKMCESHKCKNKPKWLTPDGEIKEMSITNKTRWHPDWIEYNI